MTEIGGYDPRRDEHCIVNHAQDPIPELGDAAERVAQGRITSVRFRSFGCELHPFHPCDVDPAVGRDFGSVSAQRERVSVQLAPPTGLDNEGWDAAPLATWATSFDVESVPDSRSAITYAPRSAIARVAVSPGRPRWRAVAA